MLKRKQLQVWHGPHHLQIGSRTDHPGRSTYSPIFGGRDACAQWSELLWGLVRLIFLVLQLGLCFVLQLGLCFVLFLGLCFLVFSLEHLDIVLQHFHLLPESVEHDRLLRSSCGVGLQLLLHHVFELVHFLLQRYLEAGLEQPIPDVRLGLQNIQSFPHVLIGVRVLPLSPRVILSRHSQLAIFAMTTFLVLIEAQCFDDAVGDDDLIHIHELELLAMDSQFLDYLGEGRGQGGIVEILGQPHSHDEQQFPAEELDGPDRLHPLPVVLQNLLLEDRQQVGDEILVDVQISNEQQRGDKLDRVGLTLEAYLRILVFISVLRTFLRCAKMQSQLSSCILKSPRTISRMYSQTSSSFLERALPKFSSLFWTPEPSIAIQGFRSFFIRLLCKLQQREHFFPLSDWSPVSDWMQALRDSKPQSNHQQALQYDIFVLTMHFGISEQG